jgi:hypothetical protein
LWTNRKFFAITQTVHCVSCLNLWNEMPFTVPMEGHVGGLCSFGAKCFDASAQCVEGRCHCAEGYEPSRVDLTCSKSGFPFACFIAQRNL